MVRNAGKFGKPKRGGKKMFTQDLKPLDDSGEKSGMWDENGDQSSGEEDSEEEESEEEEESGEERDDDLNAKLASTSIGPFSNPQASTAESRQERKAAKKKMAGKNNSQKKEDEDGEEGEDDEDLVNPNRAVKKAVKVSEISKVATGPMNRKEREAVEKKAAQERYWKLHQAGKTDEAKVDLARLAKIRQEREQAAAFRKAEAEAKAKEVAEKAALSSRKKR